MKDLNILVADDDKEIADLVGKYLEVEGYNVKVTYTGTDAYNLFKRNNFDVIILDVMMPGMDGIELIRNIREKTQAFIILLTAKDTELDRVVGLKSGADDYVVKPFYMNELIARVQSYKRRYSLSHKENKILEFEGLTIDPEKIKVIKNGMSIDLKAKEFEILLFLAENEGKVFSKEKIFEEVWKDNFYADDNTVMVHIRRLRKNIEDNPDKPAFINTVWGLGYKFIGKRR